MRATSSRTRRRPDAALGRLEVDDHDLRPLGLEPAAIAAPIPCAPPVTIATLPSSAPISEAARTRSGRGSGSAACGRAAAPWRGTPSSAGRLQPRALLLAVGERLVAPERRVGREGADLGRERADEPAEDLLLERDALLSYSRSTRGACPCTRGSRAARRSCAADPADRPVLQLEPLVDPVRRALAADPRLLHAAERRDLRRDEPVLIPTIPYSSASATPRHASEPPSRSTPRARTACRSRSERPPPRSRSARSRRRGRTSPRCSSPSRP